MQQIDRVVEVVEETLKGEAVFFFNLFTPQVACTVLCVGACLFVADGITFKFNSTT